MSKENNSKILMGSISQSLDKLIILGETGKDSLSVLSILVEYFNYCLDQYNAGNEEYWEKMQVINNMIINLKNTCSNICNYKDRLLLTKYNTAPSIQSNVITLPISNSVQTLPYKEVVFNYSDPENDLISSIGIISKDAENDLLINGSSAIVNSEYAANSNFSAKYVYGSGNMFIVKNSTSLPCNSTIVAVNESGYTSAKQTHFLADANDGTNTIFKRIVNEVEELPNDTIIYVHIDTSSMAVPDQETIRDLTLEWWDGFQVDNPDFEGSLLINTVPNQDISDDYAPGREGNGILTVPGNLASGGVEAWVDNPAQGLARQGWKEGLTHFTSEQAFIDYITDKSLVVLTFVDETNAQYHGTSIPLSFSSSDIYQPTVTYINHYTSFLTKVRPYVKFFKGVLYPIIRPNSGAPSNFLLHAVAAMEATTLTSTEIDTLLGPDVVAAYGTNMQTWFYDNLATNNPYSNLGGLKGAGWEANFTKLSPASEVFTSEEFAEELNSILTDTSNVQVSFIDTIEVPSTDLGNTVSTDFSIKVRDNNAQQPLWSNVATIDIQYTSECEDTPLCGGEITSVSIQHKENYIFQLSDFISPSDPQIDKVKILSAAFTQGQLKYYNLTVTSSHTPLVIPIQDIVDGHLSYISDSTVDESYNIEITYSLAYIGIDNYCSDENTISITKQANPNSPATIVTQDVEITLPTNSTTIPTTITYIGNGGYSIVWSKVSGPSQGDIVDNTVEDVQLENLVEGVYTFRCTVITDVDNYVTTANASVSVVEAEQEVFFATTTSNYSQWRIEKIQTSGNESSTLEVVFRDNLTNSLLGTIPITGGLLLQEVFDVSVTSNDIDVYIKGFIDDVEEIIIIEMGDDGSASRELSVFQVTEFPKLEGIKLTNETLPALDLSNNPNLKSLDLRYCDPIPGGLDISNNTLLEIFDLSYSNIGNVDISSNINLKELRYFENDTLTTLDLTLHNSLEDLRIYNSPNLTDASVTLNSNIKQLWYGGNPFDLTPLSNLEILKIYLSSDMSIDLTQIPQIKDIQSYGGTLTVTTLSQLLIDLDANGEINGNFSNFPATTLTTAGETAYNNLLTKGWTVTGFTTN